MTTPKKNLAAVLMGTKTIDLQEREIQEPKEGEVLVAIHSVGVCGSDVHFWKDGRIGNFVVKKPHVLGHESSGTIMKLGPGVTTLKEGDRVAIEPGVPCYKCKRCLQGRYNLCARVRFVSAPPYDGCFTRYLVHDANFCFKLPDHVSFEEGALLEPIAVGVHACRRGGVALGSRVLICGAGPIGLVHILVAKAMGAEVVAITDFRQHRLDMAKHLGADKCFLLNTSDPKGDKIIEEIKRYFGDDEGADACIECSGADAGVDMAIRCCRDGGCAVIVGVGKDRVELPLLEASIREVDIRGVFRYLHCFPAAIALVAQGKVDVKKLITHRFDLTQAAEAVQTASDPASNSIKVMIRCAEKEE